MNLEEFFNNVEAHPDLEGVGIDEKKMVLHVRHNPSKINTAIPVEAIDHDDVKWDILEDVLTGKREPQVLFHMTRVVGYYSRVDNWNQSKVGELKDRQKGNYAM